MPPGRRSGPTRQEEAAAENTNTDASMIAEQRDHWRVHAVTYVVAGRCRSRFVLIVSRCPRCGQSHTHTAPMGFVAGMRTAACGVRYVVIVDVLAVAS